MSDFAGDVVTLFTQNLVAEDFGDGTSFLAFAVVDAQTLVLVIKRHGELDRVAFHLGVEVLFRLRPAFNRHGTVIHLKNEHLLRARAECKRNGVFGAALPALHKILQ